MVFCEYSFTVQVFFIKGLYINLTWHRDTTALFIQVRDPLRFIRFIHCTMVITLSWSFISLRKNGTRGDGRAVQALQPRREPAVGHASRVPAGGESGEEAVMSDVC